MKRGGQKFFRDFSHSVGQVRQFSTHVENRFSEKVNFECSLRTKFIRFLSASPLAISTQEYYILMVAVAIARNLVSCFHATTQTPKIIWITQVEFLRTLCHMQESSVHFIIGISGLQYQTTATCKAFRRPRAFCQICLRNQFHQN